MVAAMTEKSSILKELSDQKFALDQAAIVAQTDAQGRITYVNEKFCEVSEYSRGDLIGKTHKLVNSGYHGPEFFKEMWKTISNGKVWRGEVCNRKKGGDPYWVATTIVPFLDESGKPYQYLAIRQDITDLKKAQQVILDQQSQLVVTGKLSAIGEMAAAITHEINNPLGVILGRCEMIKGLVTKDQADKETLLRMIDTIDSTGKRIERIVKSMRTLAFQGEDEPFYPVSVRDLLADSLELCQQRFRNHGIRLSIPEVSKEVVVNCRAHQIVQVIVNLFNNSHDAILEKPDPWVTLEVFDHQDRVEFSVTDSGLGISPENQEKLFQPFFSTKRVQYGTGLGLSLSQGLIRQHQGQLSYDASSANTRFYFFIPKGLRSNR